MLQWFSRETRNVSRETRNVSRETRPVSQETRREVVTYFWAVLYNTKCINNNSWLTHPRSTHQHDLTSPPFSEQTWASNYEETWYSSFTNSTVKLNHLYIKLKLITDLPSTISITKPGFLYEWKYNVSPKAPSVRAGLNTGMLFC